MGFNPFPKKEPSGDPADPFSEAGLAAAGGPQFKNQKKARYNDDGSLDERNGLTRFFDGLASGQGAEQITDTLTGDDPGAVAARVALAAIAGGIGWATVAAVTGGSATRGAAVGAAVGGGLQLASSLLGDK